MSIRRLPLAAVISLGLHLGLLCVALLYLRSAGPAPEPSDNQAAVELVMEEHQGEARPDASTPAPPAPPAEALAEQAKPPAPAPAEEPEQGQAPAEPAQEGPAEGAVKTAETPNKADLASPKEPAEEARTESRPEPAADPPAPEITLSGTDSPSDALAWGDQIIPAAPDAVFHNQPPEYPLDAALRGQHGVVDVVIHISSAGRAAGVDVISSSGYASLDRAAREAVSRWQFLPAVRGGRTVASEMPMRFIFGGN